MKSSEPRWEEKPPSETEKLTDHCALILNRLDTGKNLTARDRKLLTTVIIRWLAGDDLRVDFYEPRRGRARPKNTSRDKRVAMRYFLEMGKRGAAHKHVIGRIADLEGLSDETVRKIVIRMKPVLDDWSNSRDYLT